MRKKAAGRRLAITTAVVVIGALTFVSGLQVFANQAEPLGDSIGVMPISEGFIIETDAKSSLLPISLKDGQVWTDKSVKLLSETDGTFEIKLSVWGKEFAGLPPLEEGSSVIFTDVLGEQFEVAGSPPEGLTIHGDQAIWTVPGDEITGNNPKSITFTVKLKSGWETGLPGYYTNQSADARFTPAQENEFYHYPRVMTRELFKVEIFSWNNSGSGMGFNEFSIYDKDLGLFIVLEDGKAAVIGGQTYQPAGIGLDPELAPIYTWGYSCVIVSPTEKYYHFWVKGLEGDNKYTTYKILALNQGGHNSTPSLTSVTTIGDLEKRLSFTWDQEDVIEELPNNGWILITLDKKETVTESNSSTTTTANETTSGEPEATTTMTATVATTTAAVVATTTTGTITTGTRPERRTTATSVAATLGATDPGSSETESTYVTSSTKDSSSEEGRATAVSVNESTGAATLETVGNTGKDVNDPGKGPQTGDNSNQNMLIIVAALAGLACLVMGLSFLKKCKGKN